MLQQEQQLNQAQLQDIKELKDKWYTKKELKMMETEKKTRGRDCWKQGEGYNVTRVKYGEESKQ